MESLFVWVTQHKWMLLLTQALIIWGILCMTATVQWANQGKPIKQHNYDVILSSYMRSGSSYAGRLLGHRRDSFYFYEPLWSLATNDYFRNSSSLCSATSAACRTITKYEEENLTKLSMLQYGNRGTPFLSDIRSVPLKTIQNILKCNFADMANIFTGVNYNSYFAGPIWAHFNECMNRNTSERECLINQELYCQQARHRTAKVLRLQIGDFETILQNNGQVIVAHLLRDPRAVLNSRIRTDWYELSEEDTDKIRDDAEGLCNKMMLDYHQGLRLKQKYPHRFHFIFYEDLLEVPHFKAIQFYKLFKMDMDVNELQKFIKVSSDPSNGSTHNPYWWREVLSWKSVEAIDSVCSQLYEILGYRILPNESVLRDLNIPSHGILPFILGYNM